MITFAVLALVLGALWLTAALVGFVFKLTFALLGGVFGLLAGFTGLLVGALMLLIMVPLAALALLPVLLPALGVAALVWLVVRAARRPAAPGVTVTH